MPTNSTSWFDVDKAGLSRLVLGRKRSALIYELVSNSLDENSTTVEVHLCRLSRGLARLDVHDDNPSGFADLSHGYTLFADSGKKNNPTQRGRFNLGEKLVLACCNNARITSTTGTIRFTPQGREFDPDHKTEIGTVFSAHIRMTVKEIAEAVQDLKRILVPSHQEVRINGNPLPRRTPTATFSATLKTETADPDTGILRRTSRKTKVWLYPVLGGEKPMLHEMGIPVVRLGGDRWHVDIAQKIPLTLDRTNVPPSFVQAVRTTIVNHMAEALTEEDVTQPWVTQAISDKKIEPAALTQVVDKRFGPDAVTYDPSDPEGSKIAMSNGRRVIYGASLPKAAWTQVREKAENRLLPAGQVTPSSKVEFSKTGKNINIPRSEWTEGMVRVADYTKQVTKVLGILVTVEMVKSEQTFLACYGKPQDGLLGEIFGETDTLMFNVPRLGDKWFDQPDELEIDKLIIHELGHHFSGDHLSADYYDGLCHIGAVMKQNADVLKF